MTIIAFDGSRIAVDRRVTTGSTVGHARKWRKLRGGTLLLWAGTLSSAVATAHWYAHGAEPGLWPDCQREAPAWLVIVRAGKVFEMEGEPHEREVEGPFAAWGSGREVALGAFDRGATALQAAEAACRWNALCGGPIDVFDLRGRQVAAS